MTKTTLQIENFSTEEFQQFIIETLRPYLKEQTTGRQEQFKTRKETASILRITLPTLNHWSKLGIIQSAKIGSRVLYRLSDIEECIKDTRNYKYKRDR